MDKLTKSMTEYNQATLKREILEDEGQGLQGPCGWLSVLRRCLPRRWPGSIPGPGQTYV
jgi:hypothetical protein